MDEKERLETLKEEVRLLKEILELKEKIAELENKQPIPAPDPTFPNVWIGTFPDESIIIS